MWYGNALASDQCNKIRDTENSGGSVNWPCKRYRALVQKTSVAICDWEAFGTVLLDIQSQQVISI